MSRPNKQLSSVAKSEIRTFYFLLFLLGIIVLSGVIDLALDHDSEPTGPPPVAFASATA
jgi:hypothetical protein